MGSNFPLEVTNFIRDININVIKKLKQTTSTFGLFSAEMLCGGLDLLGGVQSLLRGCMTT